MKQAHFYMPAGEINPFGNGASKRSAQISALLLVHFQIENINIIPGTFFSKFSRYYHALKFLVANPIKISTFKDFSILGYHYLNGKKNINNYKGNPQYLFWESTLNNYHYKPLLYKKMGCKLIAFPHNLESLVPGQYSTLSNKPSPIWLHEELDQLRLCDHVFTISEEEHWFLALNGIKSSYYPYYPTQELENNLLEIRALRPKDKNEGFYLMFGSFFYKPIRQGLLEILKVLNNTDVKVKISGFGSDTILESIDYPLNPNIEIIGESTPQELNQLLTDCKGVIVNQAMSSGALTKLKELQIAGVPVILNDASTRSFKNVNGFYVFHDFGEFTELLTKDLEIPELPSKNEYYNQRVIKIINSL